MSMSEPAPRERETPSSARNKVENRIRRISGRKSRRERLEASEEGARILLDYAQQMREEIAEHGE